MNNKGIAIVFLVGILIGGILSYWIFSPVKPQDNVYQAQKDSAAKAITILQDSLELTVRNDSAIMDQMRVLQANQNQIIYIHDKTDNIIDTLLPDGQIELLRTNLSKHR